MAIDDSEDPVEVPDRYKTLPVDSIDEEYLSDLILSAWTNCNSEREDFLTRREGWMTSWRSLVPQPREGPWENSANFHVPLVLTYGKAIHARLWQIFGTRDGFFNVAARRHDRKAAEQPVKEFMDFVWGQWANRKIGCKDVSDEWLWDVIFEGSGYLKLYWHREVNKYLDSVPVAVVSERFIFDRDQAIGRTEQSVDIEQEDEIKEEVLECPMIATIDVEDIITPLGQPDPQVSDWVIQQVAMNDEALKVLVRDGKFNREAVEESIKHKENVYLGADYATDIKQIRKNVDGDGGFTNYTSENEHIILEWYGKAYVTKNYEDTDETDLDKFPQEIVVWVHKATKKVLGWTYLYRVSPSGIRPIFKADFLKFPGRNCGVGVPELLSEINNSADAIYNLRVDNGTIASVPMGFYRASSGLKADTISIQPGTLYPVDDVNDVRMTQFPYLAGFGEKEEANLTGYAERLLAVSDIQLGISPQKVGALRNATGSNLIASESGIQLEIHFDRLARTLDRLLQAMFGLCRQRMPERLYYRVTGERGENIFGEVKKEDLRGEYDFLINVDILGQSRTEKQQQSVLNMQTLMNPTFLQTGVVGPTNLYNLAKDFLRANKTARIDDYLTKPADYEGEIISPAERFFRISVGQLDGIAESVRLNEDHEKALQIYEAFKADDTFYGLLTAPEQVQALERLIAKHQQLLAAQNGGGMLNNVTGMQVPQGGMPALEGVIGGGGSSLQGQQAAQGVGTPQGPVV